GVRHRLRADPRRTGGRDRAAELPGLSGHLQFPRSRLWIGDRQRDLRRHHAAGDPLCLAVVAAPHGGAMSFARRREGGPLLRTFIGLCLAVFVVWSAAPVIWLVLSSVLEQQALISQPPDVSPAGFTLDNFIQVISAAAALGHGIMHSAIVALFSTAVALAL